MTEQKKRLHLILQVWNFHPKYAVLLSNIFEVTLKWPQNDHNNYLRMYWIYL